jgi:hypothetical protein
MQALRKMQRRWDPHGYSWRDSHTTEKAGENYRATYVTVRKIDILRKKAFFF